MSSGRPPPGSVRGLLRLAGVAPGGDATDRDLVRAFALDRSEAAFAALMARHGPMVRAVCRRALRDQHLADDAVQATFVVLARRAGAVRWKESLAGWLFEVARRVSRKAAVQAARRAAR
ncbi:MAG: sigma-70 family RNA polymerase sigma factor, partial [Gemmataceae bacterium]|nr:sigma-70 family RNA polymerase sigma factor [Gemmataceae bacterium]